MGRLSQGGPVPARRSSVVDQYLVANDRTVAHQAEAFVATAHRVGVQEHVWTIDDPAEMERLLDLGVDGIMTDRPQVLKDVLSARGAWHG